MGAEISLFNAKHGYCEALVRGLRSSLLSAEDFRRMGLAETLEDLRSALEETEYGGFLQDEPSPLAVTTIGLRAREKFVSEFKHLRSMANYPLNRFLDFVSHEAMIDNVVGLIQGTFNQKPAEELLSHCDPLGWFPEMRAIASMDLTLGYEELYRTLLVDTPVGKYFEAFVNSQYGADEGRSIQDVANFFSETDLEIMRNILKRSWLEDFHEFCRTIGGTTELVMDHILKSEADFRVLAVTLNSINTNLGGDSTQLGDRNAMYPAFGYLYPEGTDKIRKAWNETTLRAALEGHSKYMHMYEQCKALYVSEEGLANPEGELLQAEGLRSVEDIMFAEQIKLCEDAFETQMHFGVFYAWVKLKEQEIRNILWVSDMILMQRKEHIAAIVPIFEPRY